MTKYLSIDVETGGLGTEYSLLSAAFYVYDKDFQLCNFLDLPLIPDDGIIHVCSPALRVNNINLTTHDGEAWRYKDFKPKLYALLDEESNAGADKLIPVGKNLQGDLDFIWKYLMHRGTWEIFVSYRQFELNGALRYLQALGKLPEELGSMESIASHYGIQFDDEMLHTAGGDAELQMQILWRMLND